jgi:hypothetical protein
MLRVTPGERILIEVHWMTSGVDEAVARRVPEELEAVLRTLVERPGRRLGSVLERLEETARRNRAGAREEVRRANVEKLRRLKRR